MPALASWTVAISLLAAAAAVILVGTSSEHLTLWDVGTGLFIPGLYCLPYWLPYWLMSLFAWWKQDATTVSWVLLAAMVLLCVLGLYVLGQDSYQYHTESDYRFPQRGMPLVASL